MDSRTIYAPEGSGQSPIYILARDEATRRRTGITATVCLHWVSFVERRYFDETGDGKHANNVATSRLLDGKVEKRHTHRRERGEHGTIHIGVARC